MGPKFWELPMCSRMRDNQGSFVPLSEKMRVLFGVMRPNPINDPHLMSCGLESVAQKQNQDGASLDPSTLNPKPPGWRITSSAASLQMIWVSGRQPL